MRHRQVRDVMQTGLVPVTPAASLKSLVDILVRQKIGAVPVVSAQGKVVGVVTETDLIKKGELQRDPYCMRQPRMSSRTRRAIATAETAGDLMSTHPATVRPDTSVAQAAWLMERRQAACLPVVDGSRRLLGVVGPRDLLRILLRPDEDIKSDIISQVLDSYLGTNPSLVQVKVTDGVVRMTGELERKSMLPSVLPAVRVIDGVIDAEGEFTYAIDDTRQACPVSCQAS